MRKLATTLAAAGLVVSFAMITPAAEAQSSDQRIAEIIVYGNDPCPRSTADEVVVCARKPEAERYRIPERYRSGGARLTREAWANRARSIEMVGRTGINSCSPVGPGGHTGCLEQMIARAQEEAREEAQAQTPPEE